MPPLITEIWSGFRYQRGVSARQQFLVTGYSDAESARSACPIQPGDRFLFDDRLFAKQPTVTLPKGVQNFVLDVDFQLPSFNGNGGDGDPTSLLNLPPQYKWDISETSVEVDRDKYGNPITNSALDPFAQNPTDTDSVISYTYSRYVRPNDQIGPRCIAFSNTVNNAAILLPGFGLADKGQVKCRSIMPAAAFDRTMEAFQLVSQFEIRREGWKIRTLDKGRRSFFGDSILIDTLYHLDDDGNLGSAVSEDVLFNTRGRPLSEGRYVVGRKGLVPVSNYQLAPEIEFDRSSPTGHYIIWSRREEMDFGALGMVA